MSGTLFLVNLASVALIGLTTGFAGYHNAPVIFLVALTSVAASTVAYHVGRTDGRRRT